jgi:glycine betaine/proline transport system ATP-binding protein
VRLDVSSVHKIFAEDPRPALEMLTAGACKDEVYQKLGVVVGVRDASFQVCSGEIFVIMGLSGSGKSTMIRLLNRLIEPSAGRIVFDGRDLVTMSKRELIAVRRRDMSMVFQSFALMPHLTALDNAALGLLIAGVPKPKRHGTAMRALEQVGLGQYAHRYPREMSGGMQQRVGLARALANNPTILLMDEPFSALDPLIRTEMQDELLRLQREYQRTIVFISHDLDEALRMGNRIAIMKGGSIVQTGTPYEILQDPADDYVRSFPTAARPPVRSSPRAARTSGGGARQRDSPVHARTRPTYPGHRDLHPHGGIRRRRGAAVGAQPREPRHHDHCRARP